MIIKYIWRDIFTCVLRQNLSNCGKKVEKDYLCTLANQSSIVDVRCSCIKHMCTRAETQNPVITVQGVPERLIRIFFPFSTIEGALRPKSQ